MHRIVLVALSIVAGSQAAEPVKPMILTSPQIPKLPPGFDVDKMADKQEAAKAAEWIEKEYPAPRCEAVRMLLAILRGMRSDGSGSWFDPAHSRYTFAWLAERAGVDPKAKKIPAEKLATAPALLERLDRDGDGRVTPSDFDWSDENPYVQQMGVVNRLFRRLDINSDGHLTHEELDEFLKRISKGKDYATAADLRDLMLPRGPNGFLPGDAPSKPMLLRSLFSEELGALTEGPRLNDPAPDFTLKTRDGKESVTFSKVLGKKPTVLLLGNFTCGPFRALYPEVDAIYQRYKGKANFLMVYVREAHPVDGWRMESNQKSGIEVRQPRTLDERVGVCDQFCQRLKPGMTVLVDDITDPVGRAYSGMPGRLYVIDAQGKVAYKAGRGPFGFSFGEMEQALVMSIIESSGDKSHK